MKNLFTFAHSLELVAVIISAVALLAVLQTFIVGQHYIIPTLILSNFIVLANVTWRAVDDSIWAKKCLFWFFLIICCHAFFALFWAVQPREFLGNAFIYIYGATFLILAFLCWQYARLNALFNR